VHDYRLGEIYESLLLWLVSERELNQIENIQDAVKGYLKSLRKHNESIPSSIDEGIVEVAI